MTNPMSATRLLCPDALAATVEPDGLSPALETASSVLATLGDHDVGLWEAGPGLDDDKEVDEIFVVLSGAGTVTFADGSTIDLRPGVVVRLEAGDRTTWAITERLRKLYIA